MSIGGYKIRNKGAEFIQQCQGSSLWRQSWFIAGGFLMIAGFDGPELKTQASCPAIVILLLLGK